jgi:anti-sigma factor RsiW
MNCEEYRAAALAGESSEAGRRHLAGCPECRALVDRITQLRAAMGSEAVWEEPAPDLAGRVASLVAGTEERPNRILRGGMVPWFAAAAAVLLAVVVGWAMLLRPVGPDWEVALPATGLAPGARASVTGWNEATGTRMVLSVTGLEPAPEGHVYELWLSAGPVYVSAGTFTGSGDIELWSGVARADFPRLWVTVEPIDGDVGPSGVTILDTGL